MTKSVKREYPLVRHPGSQDTQLFWYSHGPLQTPPVDQGTRLRLLCTMLATHKFILIRCLQVHLLATESYFFSLEAHASLYSSNKEESL